MPWREGLEEENDWIDLQIADIWGQAKKYVSGSLQSGIFIREEKLEMAEKTILDGRVNVCLPSELECVELSKTVQIQEIPDYIQNSCASWFPEGDLFYSSKWNCGFGFCYWSESLDFDTTYEETTKMMERYQLETVFYERETSDFLTFTSKGYGKENNQLYCFPFFIPLQEGELGGIVCCDRDDAVIWKKLTYVILHSVK